MTAKSTFISLPPVRVKVLRHSLLLVGLYVAVGIFMMAAVFLASGVTPKVIHMNYDSIEAATKMERAWTAIHHPDEYKQKSMELWKEQFEKALSFEETNVTEPGEKEATLGIRSLWDSAKKAQFEPDHAAYAKMVDSLNRIIGVNEQGMFQLAQSSAVMSRRIFLGTSALFFITILLALYLADGLAVKIASPLKQLAEVLRKKPLPGSKLKLPEPTSLEMRILTHEMKMLWERLSHLQKLNLEEVSVQRQKLEAVLASVDDAILVVDNQEHIIHCNVGMMTMLGLSQAEILGRVWRDLSTFDENYMRLREILTPELANEQHTTDLAVGGKKRTFSGRCRAFYDDRGNQIGTLYLLHDITEIKQRDRLKTEFIGVLSHELKTPLQSLSTASELLYARKPNIVDEDEKVLVETIHEDVGRIRAVANEFVQVGLVDLHSLKLKMSRVPVNEMLPQWIQPFQVLAKDRGVKVEFIKEGSDTIFAQIDAVKFPWAISNLLSNALRVSPDKSTVTIYLTDRERRVDIEVRDQGPGVPEEVRKHMFEPYFQGDSISPETAKGFLGLGLTITKEVVEAHDGMIEYFPRKPVGSTFRISLPLNH